MTKRGCKNSPNAFCYICGNVAIKKHQRNFLNNKMEHIREKLWKKINIAKKNFNSIQKNSWISKGMN